jgi:hypothetical protein
MRLPQSHSVALSCGIFLACIVASTTSITPSAWAASQQLRATPATIDFGATVVGQTQTQEVVLTNTGTTSVTISGLSASDADFSIATTNPTPIALAPGGQTVISVSFSPKQNQWQESQVAVTSNASNPTLEIPLGGGGEKVAVLEASPSSVSFGKVAVGSTVSTPVVVTNTLKSDLTLKGLYASGNGFSVSSGVEFPLILQPGKSITLTVSFAPTSVGLSAGRSTVGGPTLNIPLQGTGTTSSTSAGQLTVSPASIGFGNVLVGATSNDIFTMSAIGGAVTVSSTSSSNSQYTISGVSFPLTIAAGQSVSANLVYSPQSVGASSATVTFNSNASDPKLQESASGTGTAPYVTLSWVASTSQVSGYDIYRGTAPGVYSKLNSTLDSGTTYTDPSVTPGTTYYYAVTSVNSSGQESGYSTPVEVQVP